METDLAVRGAGGGRGHELADGFEERMYRGVVAFEALLEFREFAGEFDVISEELARLHEGAHDGDVDLHGALAAQDAGEHGHPLFRERIGEVAAPTVGRT